MRRSPSAQGDPPTTLSSGEPFDDEGGDKTRLGVRQGPYSEEMTEMAQQGWESSWTKLDSLLAR